MPFGSRSRCSTARGRTKQSVPAQVQSRERTSRRRPRGPPVPVSVLVLTGAETLGQQLSARCLEWGLRRVGVRHDFVAVTRGKTVRRPFVSGHWQVLHWPRSLDPYYAKLFAVRRMLAMLGQDTEAILYIDYDHCVLASPRLRPPSEATIVVSSEADACTRGRRCRVCLGHLRWHPNTSLMWGTPASLKKVSDGWNGAYEDLRDADARHREEISFGVAAHRAGVRLVPASHRLQGSWRMRRRSAALFHFGGTSREAVVMKGLLDAVAVQRRRREESERLESTIRNAVLAML